MFSMAVEDALLTDLVMALARLTEDAETCGRPNLSLKYLLNVLKEHGNSPGLFHRCEARVQEIVNLLNPLKDFRNKVIAHRDRPTAMAMQPVRLPLTPNEISQFSSDLADVLNAIDEHYTDSATAFENPVGMGDVATLVQYIRRGIKGFDDDDQKLRGT
jgi:hypothetical protein